MDGIMDGMPAVLPVQFVGRLCLRTPDKH